MNRLEMIEAENKETFKKFLFKEKSQDLGDILSQKTNYENEADRMGNALFPQPKEKITATSRTKANELEKRGKKALQPGKKQDKIPKTIDIHTKAVKGPSETLKDKYDKAQDPAVNSIKCKFGICDKPEQKEASPNKPGFKKPGKKKQKKPKNQNQNQQQPNQNQDQQQPNQGGGQQPNQGGGQQPNQGGQQPNQGGQQPNQGGQQPNQGGQQPNQGGQQPNQGGQQPNQGGGQQSNNPQYTQNSPQEPASADKDQLNNDPNNNPDEVDKSKWPYNNNRNKRPQKMVPEDNRQKKPPVPGPLQQMPANGGGGGNQGIIYNFGGFSGGRQGGGEQFFGGYSNRYNRYGYGYSSDYQSESEQFKYESSRMQRQNHYGFDSSEESSSSQSSSSNSSSFSNMFYNMNQSSKLTSEMKKMLTEQGFQGATGTYIEGGTSFSKETMSNYESQSQSQSQSSSFDQHSQSSTSEGSSGSDGLIMVDGTVVTAMNSSSSSEEGSTASFSSFSSSSGSFACEFKCNKEEIVKLIDPRYKLSRPMGRYLNKDNTLRFYSTDTVTRKAVATKVFFKGYPNTCKFYNQELDKSFMDNLNDCRDHQMLINRLYNLPTNSKRQINSDDKPRYDDVMLPECLNSESDPQAKTHFVNIYTLPQGINLSDMCMLEKSVNQRNTCVPYLRIIAQGVLHGLDIFNIGNRYYKHGNIYPHNLYLIMQPNVNKIFLDNMNYDPKKFDDVAEKPLKKDMDMLGDTLIQILTGTEEQVVKGNVEDSFSVFTQIKNYFQQNNIEISTQASALNMPDNLNFESGKMMTKTEVESKLQSSIFNFIFRLKSKKNQFIDINQALNHDFLLSTHMAGKNVPGETWDSSPADY